MPVVHIGLNVPMLFCFTTTQHAQPIRSLLSVIRGTQPIRGLLCAGFLRKWIFQYGAVLSILSLCKSLWTKIKIYLVVSTANLVKIWYLELPRMFDTRIGLVQHINGSSKSLRSQENILSREGCMIWSRAHRKSGSEKAPAASMFVFLNTCYSTAIN